MTTYETPTSPGSGADATGPAGDEGFWFLGGQVRVLHRGADTGDAMSVLRFDDRRGQAPPLHVHGHEDELWIVLDGEISFYVGDTRLDRQPGQTAFGPRGVPHSYLVRSETSQLLVVYTPAGIDAWFAVNASPVDPAGPMPPGFDLPRILATAQTYQVSVAGPPPTLGGDLR